MNPLNNDNVPPFPEISSHIQQRDTTTSTTTEAITQLASQLMENLNRRSTALANGAHFDLALRDAAVMRSICPTSSNGYLKAGDIYQQQGRHQEAAAIYEKGLTSVQSSDDGYTTLQGQHASALTAANKRVDFISQLPSDLVVSELLPLVLDNYKLDANTPCPYLYISRTWRQLFLQRNNLSFGMYRARSSQPFASSELQKFSQHVKSLSFEIGLASGTHDDNALASMNCRFPHLTEFNIQYFGSNDHNLLVILQSIGGNLTRFSLYNEGTMTSPGIRLNRILQICPNLVSVSISTSEVDLLSRQYPNITHFCLSIWENALPANTITNIISHLPSLAFLDISPIPSAQYLTTIHRHCPNLKVLRCGGIFPFDHNDYDQHLHGLQKFAFGYDTDAEPENTDGLIPQLLEHRHTLDHIVLVGGMNGMRDGRPFMDDPSVRFDRLHTLEIIAANDALIDLATFIIRRSSPHLRHVHVDFHDVHEHPIFEAIRALPNLERLEADHVAPTATPFGQLLQYHERLGTNSPLKELKLAFDYYSTLFPWSTALAALCRLEKLVITTAGIRATADYIPLLTMIGRGCPSLEYLELNCGYSPVPDGSVFAIKNHPTLKSLHLHGSSLSESYLVNLVAMRSLKHFIHSMPIKDHILELIQQHVPHIEQRP
ncbi:predicted protein [Lichtheimia corymbifera JMRC:FSU:9682]|uniref:F-box domain-containing protein n=1 Tax=Lichtheimia corymbifera JMRC:FSU:9682 TaxID=1263082 RepID=A0A068S7A1_9FUNG|nr:predicted protein [Lichtheimia corymbifera JMRC:FSU:9682]